MIGMYFGGSSVANRAQIEKVHAIVAGRAARAPLVVSSAHKGITDALVSAAREAAVGRLRAPARVLDGCRPPSPAGSAATTPCSPPSTPRSPICSAASPWCAS